MKLLAIDTATEACSAALAIDGNVRERFEVAPRRHAELILPMVDELLTKAGLRLDQIDGLAFCRGPGAFTGVRIASGVAQGIAFGGDLPVVPISTLATLAQGAYRRYGHEHIIAALDARIGEVYWGPYELGEDGLMNPVATEQVLAPDKLPLPHGKDWIGVGSGWAAYPEPLQQRVGDFTRGTVPDLLPHARDMIPLAEKAVTQGETVGAERALPVYLRDQVAVTPRSHN